MLQDRSTVRSDRITAFTDDEAGALGKPFRAVGVDSRCDETGCRFRFVNGAEFDVDFSAGFADGGEIDGEDWG